MESSTSSVLNFLEIISKDSTSEMNESPTHSSWNQYSPVEKVDEDLQQPPLNETAESLISEDSVEVILSVFWKRGKLGAAYYACADSEVHLLNDVVDVHPDFNNLKTLINQVNPSQVVTCYGLSDSFVECINETINGKTESMDENSTETRENSKKIFFMSGQKRDLGYDSCKRYILGLRFGFEPELLNEEDHILFVNSHIDLSQESMVISLGMLVKYLEKYLPQINLEHTAFQIMCVKHVSVDNLVSIDETTYKALQIFNPKVHPSAFKRNPSGTTKEGLSIFAVFNRCRTRAGSKRMREIFTNPSKCIETINERLDAVEFCCKPQHQHIVKNLIDCIKKVQNVSAAERSFQGILAKIYRTRANAEHWRSLYSSLYNSILIGDICQKHSTHSQLLDKMAKSLTRNVHEVIHYMNQVIDFEESSLKNHFTVRSGIDSKLDLLRQTFAQIPEVLVKVAEIELDDLPSFIEQCSIVYITELGYLLSVPIWKGDGSDAMDYTLPSFEVKFIVNNFVHYKTPRCVELDNVLGDSVASISDIESGIMITLIQFIHSRISDIVAVAKLVAELDCVIAFAAVAMDNNYRRPKLTRKEKMNITEGRHPLLELCLDNFVPNDTIFEHSDERMKILTGPNTSGKSVYLKQVALIAYLAHIGSFVPAQSAIIPILDHIHSRIQTVESVSTNISAFILDLKQMSYSLYNSTPNSLIVIDEFGKGTTEIDGLSLLAASLIHFIERGDKCPYVLVSTHFHTLPSLLPETPLVKLQYLDYMIENDEIIYMYKIRDGLPGSSLTHLAVKTAGLSEDSIQRSLEIRNSKGPLRCNPKLRVTQTMLREINYMKKIFELFSDDEDDEKDGGFIPNREDRQAIDRLNEIIDY